LLQTAEQLGKMNATYPHTRVWTKFTTLQTGLSDFELPNISVGQMPTRVFVVFVESAAFTGDVKLDPFEFKHFKLKYFSLNASGKTIPSIALETDFEKGQVRRAYFHLLDAVQGNCQHIETLGISLADYVKDTCVLGFNIAKSLAGPNESVTSRERGYLNCKIRFAEALPKNINAVFFLEFENMIEIDAARNVYTDYGS
jgi:hypothetical protein